MKRHVDIAVLALIALAPLVAQAPQGWKMRVDKSTAASDPDAAGDIKFVTMGSGFHATNPKAAVYWNSANTATPRLWDSRCTGIRRIPRRALILSRARLR